MMKAAGKAMKKHKKKQLLGEKLPFILKSYCLSTKREI